MVETECPVCKGKRLQKSVLSIYINGKNIFDMTDMSIGDLLAFVKKLKLNNEEKETLSIDDKIEYEVILNLRKKEGINLDKFKKRYKKELHEIYNYKELLKKNLLILNNNHLSIPEVKWYISNEIIVELLGSEVK